MRRQQPSWVGGEGRSWAVLTYGPKSMALLACPNHGDQSAMLLACPNHGDQSTTKVLVPDAAKTCRQSHVLREGECVGLRWHTGDVQVFGEPLHPAKLWCISMGRAGTVAGDSPCRASAPTPTPSCTRHQIARLDAQRHRRTPEMKNQPLVAVSALKTNAVTMMVMLSNSAMAVLIQAKIVNPTPVFSTKSTRACCRMMDTGMCILPWV